MNERRTGFRSGRLGFPLQWEQKSDVELDRHTGDYSYDKSHVFELAITILILY